MKSLEHVFCRDYLGLHIWYHIEPDTMMRMTLITGFGYCPQTNKPTNKKKIKQKRERKIQPIKEN